MKAKREVRGHVFELPLSDAAGVVTLSSASIRPIKACITNTKEGDGGGYDDGSVRGDCASTGGRGDVGGDDDDDERFPWA